MTAVEYLEIKKEEQLPNSKHPSTVFQFQLSIGFLSLDLLLPQY